MGGNYTCNECGGEGGGDSGVVPEGVMKHLCLTGDPFLGNFSLISA